jgi:hypothetical protein
MTRVLVDDTMLQKLHNLRQPLELCDATGKVLAEVMPKFDPSEWEPVEPQLSEEELRRRESSSKRTYTTAEVLAHLERL